MFGRQQDTAAARKGNASQELIPIEEVRNGVVILKDGSLRMILMTSSLNFALKSATEQDAIVLQYQNFLNSLDFSIEFFIQSRPLNIDPYLETIRLRLKAETNELLKIQISEYITFVKDFVASSNIVSKTFYISVTFTPSSLSMKKGGLGGIFGGGKQQTSFEPAQFEEYRLQLAQRASVVIDGLARCGVRAVPLNTEELIELFYSLYNPGESEKGKAPEFAKSQQENS